MTNHTTFCKYVKDTLQSFKRGDYSALDTEDPVLQTDDEREIVAALKAIQLQNRDIHDVLSKCADGDYSYQTLQNAQQNNTTILIQEVLEQLRSVVRQANTISLGDYSGEYLPKSEHDELGISLYEMTRSLREIAEVSTAISSGDFTKRVEAKGERDYLARAINEMIGSLREMERQANAIASGNYNLQIGPRSEHDELARAIDKMMKTIRSQMIDLKQSNQSLTEFAHVASHDLNAPLCKMKYSSELIREACEGKLQGSVTLLFDVITRSCDQMTALIRDLLEHASISGREASLEAVNLHEVIEEVRSDLSQNIIDAGVTLHIEPLPLVTAEKTLIRRLFQNLISNALKYRSSNPLELNIRAHSQEDSWLLSFRDNGIGIDPKYFQKIFDPFVRLNTSISIPGTGIGLATCRKIADQLGGRIWVESTVGTGSTFFVSLPKAASEIITAPTALPQKKKILMIDDDQDQLIIFSALLEKQDYDVSISTSSSIGLQILTDKPFDLVISDVHMPHLNGDELIVALRSTSRIPILMLTSSGAEREEELKALGANDFCLKNEAYHQLIPKVQRLLTTQDLK